ncbi:lantibiotic dehydratase [Streptomyces sp. XC 2026]|uniref:lantibiotic dehydratase n=2 Tax=unclassified Streptomyces TaxID=2593676 RepID=UPI001907FBB3|nr:lantibiotic dehydratase [Streptomyces sp. XC 2026]QQN77608.1 lantibiotic dehydratase [Streptomyces sp. XC 2026]
MTGTYFTAEEPMLLRVSTLPREGISGLLPQTAVSGEMSEEQLVSYVRELASHAVLRESVAISSGSLSHTLDKIGHGALPSRKKLLGTAISLTKYALRLTGRPTPFGIQAGVSIATAAERAAVRRTVPTKRVSHDARWAERATGLLLADDGVRNALTVVANDLCLLRGGRLVLPYARGADTTGDQAATSRNGSVSVRVTRLLSAVLAATRTPVTYRDLVRDTVRNFPELTGERVDGYLRELIGREVLLTSLDTQDFGGAIPGAAGTGLPAALPGIAEAVRRYTEQDLGRGRAAFEHAAATARDAVGDAVGAAENPLQVDLGADIEATLPHQVLREVESYASTLWRIAPEVPSHPHMTAYFDAFVDRYGRYGAERLETLVDSHRGLGFPTGYLHPRVEPSGLGAYERPVPEGENRERYEVTAELLHRALRGGRGEVTLGPAEIERLARHSTSEAPPSSMDLCFQLLSPGLAELTAGDFTLVASPLVGSRVIGATLGRFAELTGHTEAIAALCTDARSAPPDTLYAQVMFRPSNLRARNVMRTPRLSRHTLPVGTFPGRDAGAIDWRELIVYCDGRALRLYWERAGRHVQPFVPHMLALAERAPNLARFLSELRYTSGTKPWTPWSWAGFEAMPDLPRVRVGRVIAFPRTWRPTAALRQAAQQKDTWERGLRAWRERAQIPGAVSVARVDRVYPIDLDNAFHAEMFRRDVLKGGVMVTETTGAKERDSGWLDGRSNEIVVPLRSARRPAPTRAVTRDLARTVFAQPRHEPGGEWAYVQVHADTSAHGTFLSRHLPQVVRAVAADTDRWFFLRFGSPGPHLRLRFHRGSPEAGSRLLDSLLTALSTVRASRAIREVTVHTYEPEVSRYGGPEALPLAERVFCTDSQTAVNQIGLLQGGAGAAMGPVTLLAANHACLLTALGFDWPAWAAKQFPRSRDGEVSRAEIDAARDLITAHDTARRVAEVLPAANLEQAWTGNVAAKEYGELLWHPSSALTPVQRDHAVLSLLHMQHNRLIGSDEHSERRALTLLGHVARGLAHPGGPELGGTE